MSQLKKVVWLPLIIVVLILSPEIGFFALAFIAARTIPYYSGRDLRLVNLIILFSSLIAIIGLPNPERAVIAAGAAYGIWLFFYQVHHQHRRVESSLGMACLPIVTFQLGYVLLEPNYYQSLLETLQQQMQTQQTWFMGMAQDPAVQEQTMMILEKTAMMMPALLLITYCAALLITYRFAYASARFPLQLLTLPTSLVYVLLIALLAVFTKTLLAWNFLALLVGLLLFQGIAVILFWGTRLMQTRTLGLLLVLGLLLGIPFLSIVIIVGLLDFWLDFRKIRTGKENSQ